MSNSEEIEKADKIQKKFDVFEGHPPEVKRRTKKMTMYLVIFAVVMLFAGFTSGYIVKMSGEFWVHIVPPMMLHYSLIFLVLSSATIWLSLRYMKQGESKKSGMLLLLTFLLGMGFTITQFKGWKELSSKGMGFTVAVDENGIDKYRWNNFSEIQGEYGVDYYFHRNGEPLVENNDNYFMESDTAFKIPMKEMLRSNTNNASAFLIVLIVIHIIHLAMGLLYILVNYIRIQKGVIHKDESIRLGVNGIYWHFMGILWIYLFVFLFIIH